MARARRTPTPAPVPPPTPTPNPHLSPPVSVDQLYNKLKKAGLTLYLNTADAGVDGEPRKRLNLTYEGWPLLIAEYSSAGALARETGFDPGKRPGDGDPAYAIVGENILVQYGLTVVNKPPTAPAARWTDAATRLVAVLDPLLGPLRQSSLVPLALPTADPDADRGADSYAHRRQAEADEEAEAHQATLRPGRSGPRSGHPAAGGTTPARLIGSAQVRWPR